MKIKIIYDKEIKPKPIIKDVYKMPNIDQLIKQGFSLHMGRKYDEILHEFYEASGHYMYLPLGDKLRQWIKEGESEQVKIYISFSKIEKRCFMRLRNSLTKMKKLN